MRCAAESGGVGTVVHDPRWSDPDLTNPVVNQG